MSCTANTYHHRNWCLFKMILIDIMESSYPSSLYFLNGMMYTYELELIENSAEGIGKGGTCFPMPEPWLLYTPPQSTPQYTHGPDTMPRRTPMKLDGAWLGCWAWASMFPPGCFMMGCGGVAQAYRCPGVRACTWANTSPLPLPAPDRYLWLTHEMEGVWEHDYPCPTSQSGMTQLC